jgi:hypothetical protein
VAAAVAAGFNHRNLEPSMTTEKTIAIVCKSKRLGGSKIDLYGESYHFKPADASPDAPHVAEIPAAHARQIHRLLSIKDTYELLDPDAELPARPAPEQGQTVAAAIAGAKPPAAPVIIQSGDEQIDLTTLSREDLAKLAKEEFKIAVHHKWSEQTIIAKVIEAMRAAEEE